MSWADQVEEEEFETEISLPPWSFELDVLAQMPRVTNKNRSKANTNAGKKKADGIPSQQTQDQSAKTNTGTSAAASPSGEEPLSSRERRNRAREESRTRQVADDVDLRGRLLRIADMDPEIARAPLFCEPEDANAAGASDTVPVPDGATGDPSVPSGGTQTGFSQARVSLPDPSVSVPVTPLFQDRRPVVFPARFLMQETSQGPRPASTSAIDHVTPQGLEREAQFRRRMQEIERLDKNNPRMGPSSRDPKKQAPDDHTFEITHLEF